MPAAIDIAGKTEEIGSLWDTLAEALFGKKRRVGFTGMPGVGKSVLLDHITKVMYARGYKVPGQSEKEEVAQIKAEGTRIALTVVPGQQRSRYQREALETLFAGKKTVDGIVHVVANGYPTIRSEVARETLIQQGLDSVAAFRQAQLTAERDDLRRTCTYLRTSILRNHKPTWLLVAVNKVDLYQKPAELSAAQRYYSPDAAEESEFTKILFDLQREVGSLNFQWQTIRVCSRPEDFHWNGQTVNKTLQLREAEYYVDQFLRELARFCGI